MYYKRMERRHLNKSPSKRGTISVVPQTKKVNVHKSQTSSKSVEAKLEVETNPKYMDLELSDQINTIVIAEAFRMFDTDGSQEIDKGEFRKLVQSLGIEGQSKKIDKMMKEIDKDGSGQINLKEFSEMMEKYQNQIPIYTHLKSTFDLYDKDGDEIISEEDLIKSSIELDEVMTQEEANFMICLAHHLTPNIERPRKKVETFGMDEYEFIYFLLKSSFLKEAPIKLVKDASQQAKNTSSNMKSENAFSSFKDTLKEESLKEDD